MKILASDYDGTLRTGPVLSKDNIDAVHAFRQAGNAFGIVTGRSMESIRSEVERYALEFDFIVANNGGIIYDYGFQKIKESFMDFTKAMDLISYIKTLRCASLSINNGYRRCRMAVDKNVEDHMFKNLASTLSFEEIQTEQKIAQIVISLDDAAYAKEISDHINQVYDGYMSAYMNVNCIDIVPYGVSKGDGLRFIKDYKGYDENDVYAIGDSFNDISMIEEFHGFAVEHALEEIKQHAKYIVPEVCDAINELMKISS